MIADLLPAQAVFHALSVPDKRRLIARLSTEAAPYCGVAAAQISEAVLLREALGTTGFGGGFAIPHARLAGLGHMVALFATLASPVAYGALDGRGVDLVILLLSPVEAGAEPLKALARISRILRDAVLVEKLRAAPSAAALALLLGVGTGVRERAA
ncbi:MAG: PTS sugar transporter subunit IIA [Polymorphobacter sp.]